MKKIFILSFFCLKTFCPYEQLSLTHSSTSQPANSQKSMDQNCLCDYVPTAINIENQQNFTDNPLDFLTQGSKFPNLNTSNHSLPPDQNTSTNDLSDSTFLEEADYLKTNPSRCTSAMQ